MFEIEPIYEVVVDGVVEGYNYTSYDEAEEVANSFVAQGHEAFIEEVEE